MLYMKKRSVSTFTAETPQNMKLLFLKNLLFLDWEAYVFCMLLLKLDREIHFAVASRFCATAPCQSYSIYMISQQR